MPSTRLTDAASEPISLVEAKAMLRVQHDDDDDAIAALIRAAREQVETITRRALLVQTWRVVLDRWPADGAVPIWPVPLRSLTAVRVYGSTGVAQTLDVEDFTIDTASEPGRVLLSNVPMFAGRQHAGIELDVEVGHGEFAHGVPEPLRQAIRMLIAHWYDGSDAGDGARAVPMSVHAMLAPYRVVSL